MKIKPTYNFQFQTNERQGCFVEYIDDPTKLYSSIYAIFKPFVFILKPFKGFVTGISSIVLATIKVAAADYTEKLLKSNDINEAAKVS